MEEQGRAFVKSEDPERVTSALDSVFRRLLANLLLDFDNDKYRKVRPENEAVKRHTKGLSPAFVRFLFEALGFGGEADREGFLHFSGSRDTLKAADQIYSSLENAISEKKNAEDAFLLNVMAQHTKRQAASPCVPPSSGSRRPSEVAASPPIDSQRKTLAEETTERYLREVFHPDDFASVEELRPVVTKTLLKTGRVRNSFFEAKGLTIRRMAHGRVYACTTKCGNDCLEAHWHLYTGKGMLYAYVVHLSPDGKTLIHTGAEHGYQYNSIPGTPNFGKTVHFSEKLVSASGHLEFNKHPNKVSESCIYCGETFYKLFL